MISNLLVAITMTIVGLSKIVDPSVCHTEKNSVPILGAYQRLAWKDDGQDIESSDGSF